MRSSPPLLATRLSLSWQLFWLAFIPILLTLSHRNIVAMMVLMVVPVLFHKGLYGACRQLWRPPWHHKDTGQRLFISLVLLSFYMSLSSLWSPHAITGNGLLRAPLFVAICSLLLWAPRQYSQKDCAILLAVFAWASLIGTVLLGIEGQTGGWIRDIIPPDKDPIRDNVATARGISIALIIFPVASLALLRGGLPPYLTARKLRLTATLLAAVGLLFAAQKFGIASNSIAVFSMIPVGLIALARPQFALKSVCLFFLLALALTPFLALFLPSIETIAQSSNGPVSWLQRLSIWRYSADHIFSSPVQFIFGGGNDYARALADAKTSIDFKGLAYPLEVMPTHPHNLFIHIWLEFGLIGATLTGISLWFCHNLLVTTFANPKMISRTYTSALCMTATAVLIYASVETSLWTFWRLTAPILAIFGLHLIYQLHSSKFHTVDT